MIVHDGSTDAKLVNQSKLAAELNVNISTVSNWCRAGHIKAAGMNGARKLYDLEQARIWYSEVGRFRQGMDKPKERDATGPLIDILRDECDAEGCNLEELTVLSIEVDPFRFGKETDHKEGKWLREQFDRLAQGKQITLRGLHYRMVSIGDVIKPDGNIYRNTLDDWTWLLNKAAKAARWLGYIPFDWLIDEYNDEAVILIPEQSEPYGKLIERGYISLPEDADDAMPQPEAGNFASPQPWRIIMLGEKSSLAEVLRPIAERVGGEMQLFKGVNSITASNQIASRIVEDGRPAVILYFADFDPAGWGMPIIFARHLQGYFSMSMHRRP
jgi:hypothetical protein